MVELLPNDRFHMVSVGCPRYETPRYEGQELHHNHQGPRWTDQRRPRWKYQLGRARRLLDQRQRCTRPSARMNPHSLQGAVLV